MSTTRRLAATTSGFGHFSDVADWLSMSAQGSGAEVALQGRWRPCIFGTKETADQDAFNSALWRVNELQFQAIRL
jgi:hypothetical protein